MKAKNLTGKLPGGKRQKLIDIIPLRTPILLQFFPSYICNFKCSYCEMSVPKKDRGFISDKVHLDFNLYRRCIDECKNFPDKIKVIRFVGMGEPLIHKQLPEMIKYAKDAKICNKIEILTNGSLLTHELSNKLITAGLDSMIISIQGISAEKYKQISNVVLDFKKFVDNIKYFYKHKKKTNLYIKIVDIALDNKKDERKFFMLFGDICDGIAIEYAAPHYPGVKMNDNIELNNKKHTQFGKQVKDIHICPQSYFTIQINPDGKCVPCYSIAYPEILGDINNESIYDIWNGDRFKNFRMQMILKGKKDINNICKECKIINYRFNEEDSLEELWED
jgi:radical SAM protein with 4Fe4S-binding SPASM domain